MTVFCYLKHNQEKYMIKPTKQSQMLYSTLLVAMVVMAMLAAMLWAIASNENGDYAAELAHSSVVFYVKFPCAVALHLVLYPEVAKGMSIMKFANNQHD